MNANGKRSPLTLKNILSVAALVGILGGLFASWYEQKAAFKDALAVQKAELVKQVMECRAATRENDKRLSLLEYQVTNEFAWRDKQLDYRIAMLRLEVDMRHKKTVDLGTLPAPPKPTPSKAPASVKAIMDGKGAGPYLQSLTDPLEGIE